MLRMHDHLKYPYFVAFYENRVKVGLRICAIKNRIIPNYTNFPFRDKPCGTFLHAWIC